MLVTTFRFVSGFIVAFVRRCLPLFYSIFEEAYIFATQRPMSADELMSPDLKDSLEFILECPICYSEYEAVRVCKLQYEYIKVLNVVELDKGGRNEGQYEIKKNSPKTKQSNLIS
ncbi:hypothetical protein WR25_26870 [Diploscapter pachys]|uniref:Uncharacterized protein n=1 Tax=Diploscapter pachys TaxID=2018661 RepID=A0A2A2L711_9BILA|nr:hypothetical protein WR25_26870 [Diploscapter pachys]